MFRRRSAETSARREVLATEALAYLEPLYATALNLTRRPADAEDLVQDTYVKALRFADSFEPGSNLRAWLYTILHNTWRNRQRDAARAGMRVDSDLVEHELAVQPVGRAVTPEELLLRASIDADLQIALDGLPDVYRQAVWLRDVEDFTYAEIAQMLAVPLGTVMSRIARGRRLLFDALTQSGRSSSRRAGAGG